MALRLEVIDDQSAVLLPDHMHAKFEELLRLAGLMEDVTNGEVVLTIVDDEEIRQLNQQYRGLDKPTDVLSFSMWESGEGEAVIHYEEDDVADDNPIGDIVISAETAKRQSEDYGHSLERELGFLFVHGFLHLIGYDHADEAGEREMTAKQEQVLMKAGLAR